MKLLRVTVVLVIIAVASGANAQGCLKKMSRNITAPQPSAVTQIEYFIEVPGDQRYTGAVFHDVKPPGVLSNVLPVYDSGTNKTTFHFQGSFPQLIGSNYHFGYASGPRKVFCDEYKQGWYDGSISTEESYVNVRSVYVSGTPVAMLKLQLVNPTPHSIDVDFIGVAGVPSLPALSDLNATVFPSTAFSVIGTGFVVPGTATTMTGAATATVSLSLTSMAMAGPSPRRVIYIESKYTGGSPTPGTSQEWFAFVEQTVPMLPTGWLIVCAAVTAGIGVFVQLRQRSR